jgi:demethylmenaquinone methyltransferase/2-methoxy-6-polyprenyl-1,4-benzoquinol methylase
MGPSIPASRRSLGEVTAQYDRVARFYRPLEPLYMITPLARRKGVDALILKEGDTVLEIGAGTGRNLPYLTAAVGEAGRVIALDASRGMLHEARRLVDRRGWENVELVRQDASELELDRDVDAVLFSLSYSAMPAPRPALERAWQRLRAGGRVAVMDAGLTETRLRPLLDPVARLLIRLGPGNPYSRPWEDLARFGRVDTERFLLGIYYVCTVVKEADAAGATPAGAPEG